MSDTQVKKGRPALPVSEPAPAPFTPEEEARLETAVDTARNFNAAVNGVAAKQYLLGRMIGQAQALRAVRGFCKVGDITIIKQIKESKGYKGMQVPQEDGSLLTINTFEDFCDTIGTSRSKVDEDLQNLAVLGEDLLTSMQALGMGYRDLRRLRALPEDDRALVIESEAVRTNDPEALKDLLEELAAKRAKDKEALAEAKATAEAKDKVLAQKSKALDATKTELEKLKSLTPDARIALQNEREREALKDLHTAGLEFLGYFGKYLALLSAITQGGDGSEEFNPATLKLATDLTSGLCSQFADELLSVVDIDFRYHVYPVTLGDIELRGTSGEQGGAE